MGKGESISLLKQGSVSTPALGSGRRGLKRLRKHVLDNKPALNRPSVRRLARRAGVKRISSGIYEEAPTALRTWLKKIVGDAVVFTEHAKRFTVTLNDIIMALKRNGITIYGFDITERRRRLTRPLPRDALAKAAQKVAERHHHRVTTTITAPAPVVVQTQKQQAAKKQRTSPPSRRNQQPVHPLREASVPPSPIELHHQHQQQEQHETPPRLDATAPTSSPAHLQVSPERAMEIQTSLGAYRDTVVARQATSDAKVSRVLEWVSNHLKGRGHSGCSSSELEVVLDVLAERDAIMVTVDEAQKDKVLWFV